MGIKKSNWNYKGISLSDAYFNISVNSVEKVDNYFLCSYCARLLNPAKTIILDTFTYDFNYDIANGINILAQAYIDLKGRSGFEDSQDD